MVSEISDDNAGDPRHAKLIEALEKGMTLEEASAAIGLTSRNVRYMRKADPALDELVREAMIDADDLVEAVTFRNCLDPDPAHNSLRMFWLKTRRKPIYGDSIKQELTGADGGPLQVVKLGQSVSMDDL